MLQVESYKILREIQHNKINLLRQAVQKNNQFHWKTVVYEKTGDTPLHCAARLGFTEILEYLLTNFTPKLVDIHNNDLKTALHEAAQFSQYESCKTLLKHGADVNAIKRSDWTPLMLACTKLISDRTVTILLENGAMVNYRNKDGWTALHLVCREGHLEVFNTLITYGSDVSLKTNNGRTCLHIAALHGHIDIVKELVLNYGFNVSEHDNCRSSALHEAVLGKNIEICKFLVLKVKDNTDIFGTTLCGLNLLHLAASEGDLNVIRYLIEVLKFDVNCKSGSYGWTPLHCAARKNQKEVYDFLKSECGADESVRDNSQRQPFEYYSLGN